MKRRVTKPIESTQSEPSPVDDRSEFEKFKDLAGRLVRVPKADIDEGRRREPRARKDR